MAEFNCAQCVSNPSDQCCNGPTEPFVENGACVNSRCPYHMAGYYRRDHGSLCLNCIDDADKADRFAS